MTAGNHRLSHLCVVVDRNRLQQGARVDDTNDLEPLADKLAAFGLAVVDVEGHDHGALLDAFANVPAASGKPTAVIAHTDEGPPHLLHVRQRCLAPQGPYGRAGQPGTRRTGVPMSTATTAAAAVLHDCRDAWVSELSHSPRPTRASSPS